MLYSLSRYIFILYYGNNTGNRHNIYKRSNSVNRLKSSSSHHIQSFSYKINKFIEDAKYYNYFNVKLTLFRFFLSYFCYILFLTVYNIISFCLSLWFYPFYVLFIHKILLMTGEQKKIKSHNKLQTAYIWVKVLYSPWAIKTKVRDFFTNILFYLFWWI